MGYRYYDYKEIVDAVRKNPSQENINELGEWCSSNLDEWNGEYYTADEFRIYPVLKQKGEDYELVGYELR